MKIDQNLVNFHVGFVSKEGLEGVTMELNKVQKHLRKEEGLPKYVVVKRAFAMANQALVDNLKGQAIGAEQAIRLKLLHLCRKSYNNTTPHIWKRLSCRLPDQILANKVYSSPALWVLTGGMNGIMINVFIILWPLLLSGHVDGLDQDQKDKRHSIFVGSAAQDMAGMVLCLGWEKRGYQMGIPRSGKPKLRIATYTKADKMQQEKSLEDFQKEQLEYIEKTLKGKPDKSGLKGGKGKEKYWVGLVPYRPAYANRRRISELLDTESDVEVDDHPNDDFSRAGP